MINFVYKLLFTLYRFSSTNIGHLNSNVSTQWVLDLVAEEWLQWLPKETKRTIRCGGYYSVLVKPGFRIIGLNNNFSFFYNL